MSSGRLGLVTVEYAVASLGYSQAIWLTEVMYTLKELKCNTEVTKNHVTADIEVDVIVHWKGCIQVA